MIQMIYERTTEYPPGIAERWLVEVRLVDKSKGKKTNGYYRWDKGISVVSDDLARAYTTINQTIRRLKGEE